MFKLAICLLESQKFFLTSFEATVAFQDNLSAGCIRTDIDSPELPFQRESLLESLLGQLSYLDTYLSAEQLLGVETEEHLSWLNRQVL